jgi:hypothetical protein
MTEKCTMKNKIILILLLFLSVIPLGLAVTDEDIQSGLVRWYNIQNTTGNISSQTLIDKSGHQNATINTVYCSATNCTITTGNISNIQWPGSYNQTGLVWAFFSDSGNDKNCLFNNSNKYLLLTDWSDQKKFNSYAGGTAGTISQASNIPPELDMVTILQIGYSINYFVNTSNVSASATSLMAGGSGSTISINSIGGGAASTQGAYYLMALWNRTLSTDEIDYLYSKGKNYDPYASGGGGGAVASMSYNANTTSAGKYFNTTQKWIYASTYVNELPGHNSTTISLYTSAGLYLNITNTTALNLSYNFTNLPPGNYTLNASASNGSSTVTAASRSITIYSGSVTISNPIANSQQNRTINISYNRTITPGGAANVTYYNISLLNPSGSYNRTIKDNNNSSLSYFWNFTNESGIKPGSYFINARAIDNYSSTFDISVNFTLINSPPSAPSFAIPPGSFYFNYNTSWLANGSIDLDNDTITILYKVYNNDDATTKQDWSIAAYYLPELADIGDNLTVSAIASTTTANSSSVNSSGLVYLTLANISIIREKDNEPFNISHADEMSISVICLDDVNTVNVSSNDFKLNISCAYEYLKIDATFGNTSYFRIINPSYSLFPAIKFYMLDLTIDTGIEMILTINDLTGDYTSGEVIIKRYINSTEATIISYPVDIESSATLYLLKDALYTVTVKNNAGQSRVLGNLIASAAGEKIITLPDINFYPSDAVFGEVVNWSYDYYTNSSSGFIQLAYEDRTNQTINITFSIINAANGSLVFGSTSTNSSKTTFTFILSDPNITYVSNLTIWSNSFETVFEHKTFYPGMTVMPSTETGLFENISTYLFWISLIFCFIIGLAFSSTNSKIGLVVVLFFMFMFMSWQWVSFGSVTLVVFGLFGILVIFNLISKSKETKA